MAGRPTTNVDFRVRPTPVRHFSLSADIQASARQPTWDHRSRFPREDFHEFEYGTLKSGNVVDVGWSAETDETIILHFQWDISARSSAAWADSARDNSFDARVQELLVQWAHTQTLKTRYATMPTVSAVASYGRGNSSYINGQDAFPTGGPSASLPKSASRSPFLGLMASQVEARRRQILRSKTRLRMILKLLVRAPHNRRNGPISDTRAGAPACLRWNRP